MKCACLGSLTALAVLAACDHVTTGPDARSLESLQLQTSITQQQFTSMLESETARVKIEVSSSGLVADEVEVRPAGERGSNEELESPVTVVAMGTDGGTLTLALGGLTIGFGSGTTFRQGDHRLSAEEFAATVQQLLDDGEHPGIRAERSHSGAPQAPDDATFDATTLSLVPDAEDQEIEMNMNLDNLVLNDTPPPDGWIKVLGLSIELRVSEGTTALHVANGAIPTARFEGVVASVDVGGQSFTLANGTVVRLMDWTRIGFEAGDHHRLSSLEAVAAALDADQAVYAAGRGVVEGSEPLRLIAIRVAWMVDLPAVHVIRGLVQSVDLEAGTFVMSDGLTVKLTDATHIATHEDDLPDGASAGDGLGVLPSLEAVAAALTAGKTVGAWVAGEFEGGDPPMLVALQVAFKVVPPPISVSDGSTPPRPRVVALLP